MSKKLLTSLSFFLFSIALVSAQSQRRAEYDSLLVGDRITPAVSSVMMPKGYTEIILSNSLLTTNAVFLPDRESLDLMSRYSYLINTLQVTHGTSQSGRFNLGLDLNVRSRREDLDPDASPLKIFSKDGETLVDFERAFTSVGVRARYVPLSNNSDFVIQNTFTIPVKGGPSLGDHRYTLNTQFLYNHLLGRKAFIFGQADVLIRFANTSYKADYTVPLNVYASYLVSKHFFPFVLIGTANSWDDEFSQLSQSYSYGIGAQLQINSMFTFNLFYSDVFAGKNSSDWQVFNVGVRKVF